MAHVDARRDRELLDWMINAITVAQREPASRIARRRVSLKKRLEKRKVTWLEEAPDCCSICWDDIKEGTECVESQCCSKVRENKRTHTVYGPSDFA